MDWMLDPPEDDDLEFDCEYEEQSVELYDIDEESANASSRWQNSRNL